MNSACKHSFRSRSLFCVFEHPLLYCVMCLPLHVFICARACYLFKTYEFFCQNADAMHKMQCNAMQCSSLATNHARTTCNTICTRQINIYFASNSNSFEHFLRGSLFSCDSLFPHIAAICLHYIHFYHAHLLPLNSSILFIRLFAAITIFSAEMRACIRIAL